MGNIFFTSDQHFGHTNIIKYSDRPFDDTYEMNLALAQNYNRVVGKDDTVYHLGDFSLDEKYVKLFAPMLHGKKILLPGNHDKCHPRRERFRAIAQKYKSWGFDHVYLEPFVEFEPGILMSHCPSSDYEDPRYPEYRPAEDLYKVLLHGHVHERWQTKRNSCGSLMINVGVDQWDYEPVNIEELRKLF